MPNYFANGDQFRPPKKETGLPTLDSITGVLDRFDTRPGNNPSGCWFIIRLLTDEDNFNAYFKPDCISGDDIRRLNSLLSRKITLSCNYGAPVINVIGIESEGDLRAELLKGVAAGTIDKEDLPALLKFAKGNDGLFEMWRVFKKTVEKEGAEKVNGDIEKDIKETQAALERLSAQRDHLYDIFDRVSNEINGMREELNSALIFLQGEEYLHGTTIVSYGCHTDNLIQINDGYRDLLEAFEQFKTRKGVFVICGNTIHKIHHAFLEDKGRAFLLGSSTEFLRSKPEKVKEIIDEINGLR